MTSASIYIASKACHAPKWIDLRSKNWNIISSWINFYEKDMITDWSEHWITCVREARSADFLILYHEDNEVQKGALIELGAALAKSTKIIFVGDPEKPHQSVINHPRIRVVSTIEEALTLIENFPMFKKQIGTNVLWHSIKIN